MDSINRRRIVKLGVLSGLGLACGCQSNPLFRSSLFGPNDSQPMDQEIVNSTDVIRLPSGLAYRVMKSGSGKRPTASNVVRVHYEGRLVDGTVFDSSIARGEPTEFPVGGVIPGWTEALLLMKVGDQWELNIPSNLAYGSRGAGGKIGPNQDLIFQVELLAIK